MSIAACHQQLDHVQGCISEDPLFTAGASCSVNGWALTEFRRCGTDQILSPQCDNHQAYLHNQQHSVSPDFAPVQFLFSSYKLKLP
jgi:hypothetical protein